MQKLLVAVLFIMSFLSAAAHADTLNFALAAPTQTGVAGETIVFDATVSAPVTNTDSIYLDALDVNAMDGIFADTDDFYNNFPLFLAPGDIFSGQLFFITLGTDLPSTFSLSGLATLQGRIGSSEQLDLAATPFSVNSVITPEPSTLSMVMISLAVYAVFRATRRVIVRL